MKTMNVLAVPGVAVLDYAFAKAHGKYRLAGRKLATFAKKEDVPAGCDVMRERDPVDAGDVYYVEAWMPRSEPQQVPAEGDAGEYYKARVQEGGLAAADADTAAICGVPFRVVPKKERAGE